MIYRLLTLVILCLPCFAGAQDIQNFETSTDYYSCGLRRVSQDGYVGFMNKKGVLVIPYQFNYAQPFLKKKSLVLKGAEMTESSSTDSGESFGWQGGYWGVINVKGEVVKNFEYRRFWNNDIGDYIYVSEKGSTFYINRKGKLIEAPNLR